MNDTAPNVIVIPAKVETPQEQEKKRHLRVAAYCRVSTDKEDQLHSLAAQQAYFEGYIARHGWRCAGIFADGSSIVGLSQKELAKQVFSDLVQLFSHFTTL